MKRHFQDRSCYRHNISSETPQALRKLARPLQLTFTLRDHHLLKGALPIQELLDAASEVITQERCRRPAVG